MRKLVFPILILSFLLGIFFGSVPLDPLEVLGVLFGLKENPGVERILSLRIPRVLASFLVGAGLSIVGNSFQNLLKNPLVDPYLLGISSGASFGTVVSFYLAEIFGISWIYRIPLLSFGFSMIASLLTLLIARKEGRFPVTTIVLSGVVVSTLFSSLTYMTIVLLKRNVTTISMWLFGSFSGSTWEDVLFYLMVVIPFLLYSLIFSKHLNAMALGEEEAFILGVSVERLKVVTFLFGNLITAFLVSRSGVIGFVGLIVPHISRYLVGPNFLKSVLSSLIVGGVLLTLCDTAARTFFSPTELPVGVVTALIGAPFLAFLMKRGV
ncbi:transport system permease protein [Thermotoga sp. Mc24]|uniref:FecCD family ABC transporter permease n=1 Tax=Thermotoga sp. Mc24 TaxID=1231241 RepID=UPI0005419F30|nr:iron ABC transporter permease [Thermotoga sp. Mc24]KHC93449.1 transport system permease protein [Thermotoga sp. Mc24]